MSRSDVGSDWEIEALEDMVEKIELDETLDDYQKRKKKQLESYKHNFLHRFLEHTEQEIQRHESEKIFLQKPSFLRTREEVKTPTKLPAKAPV